MPRLAALFAAAFILAGCGGPKDATDPAQLVPADALAFVHVRGAVPPPSSFPFAPTEYAELERALPKLRRPVDVALLPEGWVAFRHTKTAKGKRVRGFAVVAETKAALDAVRRVKEPLADAPRYLAAAKTIGDAPLTAYLRSGTSWRTLEVTGKSVAVHRPGPKTSPVLSDVAVPEDAVGAVGLAAGATPPPSTVPVLMTISHALGIDVVALLHALDGPAYATLAPGDPVPRLTIVATPARPRRAKRDVGALLARLGRVTASPSPTLTTVDLGPIAILYGLDGNRLIVSDDEQSAEQKVATTSVDGLPAHVTRFAWMHGATPTIAALAPGLGLTPPRPQTDFLLYEANVDGVWSRVVQLD